MNANLLNEILDNPEEMEWLIYNGIEAYKKMIIESKDFTARIDNKKVRELLNKHTDPLLYILPKLVKYSDNDISFEDPIVANELNQLIQYVAKSEGLAISINTKGKIEPKELATKIRQYFELGSEWTTKLFSSKKISKFSYNISKTLQNRNVWVLVK